MSAVRPLDGLFDSGATSDASCTRTLAGVLPDTLGHPARGVIGVGTGNSSLNSLGSHLFMYIRQGSDDTREVVLRRLWYTPDLGVDIVCFRSMRGIRTWI